MAQIEESVARYLHQLDSADRQEPSLARTTKSTRLEEKIAKLKEEMQRLKALPRHQHRGAFGHLDQPGPVPGTKEPVFVAEGELRDRTG
jgi:hypothetical protein